jgi:pimeloyl-ACP methyl ester carboxylesterase
MLAAAMASAGTVSSAAGKRSPQRPVGQLILQKCDTPAPWCAHLSRPLDPSGAVAGSLAIYFEFYPHTGGGPASGTLVAAEGGPGYPTTDARDDYLELFRPLRRTHDVLLMDYRGTGRSGAIDCEPLQRATVLTIADIGACGRSLGATAPFYSTNYAADDLAALLVALGIDRVDLYGNSYGTYFSQVFAQRHAELLRSLVLDGTYALEGPDYPWYPHYASAMRAKLELACERAPACHAIGGSSIEHLLPALKRLRTAPFDAVVPDDAGHPVTLHADASALAIVLFGGSPALATVREADAAARAFAAGDTAPLLRLMVEAHGSMDSRRDGYSPTQFSAGLAAAVFCQDPPQVFDLKLDPAQRRAVLEREYAQRWTGLDLYAPFTLDEYRGMPPDYVFIDECLLWPAPMAGARVPPLVVPREPYPDVPVLVLSGELDNMTGGADGEAAASHYAHAQHVLIANSFHVTALSHARSDCGRELVRRFIVQLSAGDTGCATQVPAVPLVARFARKFIELDPARALAGNRAPDAVLRQVTAALETSEDAIVRAAANDGGSLVGLRGGTFHAEARGKGYRLALRAVRWTEDVSVSGHIDWPGQHGLVRAGLRLEDAAGRRGELQLRWQQGEASMAIASGRIGGWRVRAAAPVS